MKQIVLTQGKVAFVDEADYDWLNQWKWYAARSGHTFYAVRGDYSCGKENRKTIRMHRLIMQNPPCPIDHIDHNGLNNQRKNLRLCTRTQNLYNQRKYSNNSTGFIGVCYESDRNRFKASININGKQTNLGRFKTALEAAVARDEAALEYYGEFANLNFPLAA